MLLDTQYLSLKQRADSGDPHALWQLGEIYYWGNGASENRLLAKRYFTMAAEKLASHPVESDLLEKVGYLGLLAVLGEMSFSDKAYQASANWFRKAKDFAYARYPDEAEREELMEQYFVNRGLKKTETFTC